MCHIFSSQSPERWQSETRSIRLCGHSTSIRLEKAFWDTLEKISLSQGFTVPQLLMELHDEILETQGEVGNFTSLLRCACLTYAEEIERNPLAERALISEAEQAFQANLQPAG